MDEDFALLEAARMPNWTALVRDERFTRGIERAARAALVTRFPSSAAVSSTSSMACHGECLAAIKNFRARILAGVAFRDHLEYGLEPTSRQLLHLCIDGVCSEQHESATTSDCTPALRATHYALVAPTSAGGGIYYCSAHGRAHVCLGRTCAHGVENGRNALICPLSGQTLGFALMTMFGRGNTIMNDEIMHTREDNEQLRRSAAAIRRSAAGVVEMVIQTANAQLRDSTALGCGAKRSCEVLDDDDDDVYYDLDVPADDVFPERGIDNTFGDGARGLLARLYAEAYAAVYRLLMSPEREAIELRNRELVLADAIRRTQTYLKYQRSAGAPAMLCTMRQIERRAFNSRRIYPELLLPENAIARITAYYAVVCVEMHMQLAVCARTLGACATASKEMRRACERYTALSLSSVVPNVLDILHTGLRAGAITIASEETTLSIYPESQTIEELGWPQRTCTDVKKLMKLLIVEATNASMPLEQLQLTQLDAAAVMFGRESVISTFLGERRRRLDTSTP
jgi:hypothetical protein